MKITWYEGESKREFEGSVEEWLALSGETSVKPEWKPWMDWFGENERSPACSFIFKSTPEGHEWWAANYNTPHRTRPLRGNETRIQSMEGFEPMTFDPAKPVQTREGRIACVRVEYEVGEGL